MQRKHSEPSLKKNGQPKAKPGPVKGAKRRPNTKPLRNRSTGKRVSLTVLQRLEIARKYKESGWTQEVVAKHFERKFGVSKIPQKNISIWARKCAELEEEVEASGGQTRHIRSVRFPEVEAALSLWFEMREANGQPVTGPLLQLKAKRIADQLGIPPDKIEFTNGWLEGFKTRHGISNHQHHGEAGSTSPLLAEEERRRLQPILEQYAKEDIFNVDETGFFWRQLRACWIKCSWYRKAPTALHWYFEEASMLPKQICKVPWSSI